LRVGLRYLLLQVKLVVKNNMLLDFLQKSHISVSNTTDNVLKTIILLGNRDQTLSDQAIERAIFFFQIFCPFERRVLLKVGRCFTKQFDWVCRRNLVLQTTTHCFSCFWVLKDSDLALCHRWERFGGVADLEAVSRLLPLRRKFDFRLFSVYFMGRLINWWAIRDHWVRCSCLPTCQELSAFRHLLIVAITISLLALAKSVSVMMFGVLYELISVEGAVHFICALKILFIKCLLNRLRAGKHVPHTVTNRRRRALLLLEKGEASAVIRWSFELFKVFLNVAQKTIFVTLLRILNQLFEVLKCTCLQVDTLNIILCVLLGVDVLWGLLTSLSLFLKLDIYFTRTFDRRLLHRSITAWQIVKELDISMLHTG